MERLARGREGQQPVRSDGRSRRSIDRQHRIHTPRSRNALKFDSLNSESGFVCLFRCVYMVAMLTGLHQSRTRDACPRPSWYRCDVEYLGVRPPGRGSHWHGLYSAEVTRFPPRNLRAILEISEGTYYVASRAEGQVDRLVYCTWPHPLFCNAMWCSRGRGCLAQKWLASWWRFWGF